jgi:hypothetical protein
MKSYYKGGKAGNATAAYTSNTVNNSGGNCGEAIPQKPIAGPENPGPPASMRKALAKKSNEGKGIGLPNKGTSFAGSVR